MSDHVEDAANDIKIKISIMGEIIESIRGRAKVLPLPSAALPPTPKYFFGRERAVNGLVDLLVSTNVARFGILGTGGMGKTTLATAVVSDP